jgi:predicted nicotinamide N-methyase
LSLTLRNILELGAGTSLPGLFLYKKGHNVVLTDIKKFVPFITENVKLNTKENYSEQNTIQVCPLDWEDGGDISNLKQNYQKFDYIIGAELVYQEDHFDPLINVLSEISDLNTKIILSFKIRIPELTQTFLTKLSIKFNYEFLDEALYKSFYPNKKLKIISITLK